MISSPTAAPSAPIPPGDTIAVGSRSGKLGILLRKRLRSSLIGADGDLEAAQPNTAAASFEQNPRKVLKSGENSKATKGEVASANASTAAASAAMDASPLAAIASVTQASRGTGQRLPVPSHHSSSYGANNPSEDRYAHLSRPELGLHLWCICDGHGGGRAAAYVSERLCGDVAARLLALTCPEELSRDAAVLTDEKISEALTACFLHLDRQFIAELEPLDRGGQQRGYINTGCCVALVVLLGSRLFVAHVGDCRVVLGTRRSLSSFSGGGTASGYDGGSSSNSSSGGGNSSSSGNSSDSGDSSATPAGPAPGASAESGDAQSGKGSADVKLGNSSSSSSSGGGGGVSSDSDAGGRDSKGGSSNGANRRHSGASPPTKRKAAHGSDGVGKNGHSSPAVDAALSPALPPRSGGRSRGGGSGSGSSQGLRAVPLSTDHNCSNQKEVQLVKSRSSDKNAIRASKNDLWKGGKAVPRVGGSLAVTRAIGDAYLKDPALSFSPYKECVPYITAQPEVGCFALRPGDELLVIATDGVWEVFSNEEAVQWAERGFGPGAHLFAGSSSRSSNKTTSEALVQGVLARAAEAYGLSLEAMRYLPAGPSRRQLHDDITAVVVRLAWS